ncbi:hypothetical protein PQG02_22300 [Nostoc sp. UHCC 0926]|nr:hypothetical protein [Nostoc sp. UHCC 0926]WDD31427.1 hypothetical protein PQG02_22300 [Nostoc sp. UHCC 0926]
MLREQVGRAAPTHWLVYTSFTHLPGFQTLNFSLVHGGGGEFV